MPHTPTGRSGIPLRIRLSLGSALRLSLAIAAFGVIAYQTSKRAALEAAEGRARAAAFSLSERATLGLRDVVAAADTAARDPAVIAALRTGVMTAEAGAALKRLVLDSLTLGAGLRSLNGEVLVRNEKPLPRWGFDESQSPDSIRFGRVRVQSDTILFELTAPVYDGTTLLGTVFRVRRVAATPAGVQLVSNLMGERGLMLFGNSDGTAWTDLSKSVEGPPSLATTRYRKSGQDMVVASRQVTGTPYTFAAEFPVDAVLAPVRTLTREFALIGITLVILGLIAGWWFNARLTRPLVELTEAAETITASNHPELAPAPSGGDELERLQRAFHTMSDSVRQARTQLESQVRDRTRALDEQALALEKLRISEERLSAERSRLQETLRDLRASEDALRQADRRKDDFLATLAHELRNPLAPIRNAVHIFKVKSPADPQLQWGRDVIDRQVAQMTRLLDDLLDVSRISHNRLELRLQRVDLSTVVMSAVETSRPFIDGAGHELTITLPPGPVHLEADPVRLAQVFSNLLNNSAKYSIRPGHIHLTAERRDGEVVVMVSDDGIGITAEALPYIFDMFTQAAPMQEQSWGGLGIGLSLVQGLVTLHGGSVEAASPGAGQGSTFTVRLPVASSIPVSPRDPGREHAIPGTGVQRRLLIADDLEDNAESLATLFRMMGHEAWTAHDGEAAFRTAASHRPEIILLDLGMPKVDGYEACRRIRGQPWGSRVMIIALTGWGQEEDRRRTHQAGFDAHLVKPVDPAALMRLVNAHFQTTPNGGNGSEATAFEGANQADESPG